MGTCEPPLPWDQTLLVGILAWRHPGRRWIRSLTEFHFKTQAVGISTKLLQLIKKEKSFEVIYLCLYILSQSGLDGYAKFQDTVVFPMTEAGGPGKLIIDIGFPCQQVTSPATLEEFRVVGLGKLIC